MSRGYVKLLKFKYHLKLNCNFSLFFKMNVARLLLKTHAPYLQKSSRTFLSQAYYCNEVWEHRLRNPILAKVNVNELYQDLDQRFYKTHQISPVDVDIFVNSVKEESYVDEVVDIIHKLRLSASTCNTLDSTSHAVIRFLLNLKKYDELLKLINDRLNYGIFLDYYTSNLLMDTFYKAQDFVSGAQVATQLMLQEEYQHPLSVNFALLHCYKYLTNPVDWPQQQGAEEPEEEVKVRVKYLRNSYFDDHFDLTDHKKLIGKTLWMFTRDYDNILYNSLHLLGLGLHDKMEELNTTIKQFQRNNKKIYGDILNLLPEDHLIKKEGNNLIESGNIEEELIKNVKDVERKLAEKDISLQCKIYSNWEQQRKEEVEKQLQKLLVQEKLLNIENIKKDLKNQETKLWFFDNRESIDLSIINQKTLHPKKEFGKKKSPKKIDEGYIPPEVK